MIHGVVGAAAAVDSGSGVCDLDSGVVTRLTILLNSNRLDLLYNSASHSLLPDHQDGVNLSRLQLHLCSILILSLTLRAEL